MQRYAAAHGGSWPARLDELGSPLSSGITLRPVPGSEFDGRLLLLYDRAGSQRVIRFPLLRPGWAGVLASGKTVIFTKGQLECFVAGDNALRTKLGLAPIPLVDLVNDVDAELRSDR